MLSRRKKIVLSIILILILIILPLIANNIVDKKYEDISKKFVNNLDILKDNTTDASDSDSNRI